MPKRLHKTTGDYLAIAIGPALIMVLVWSLIAFLLEVFYQGEYGARLKLIMALFVFGAVLIGRIAIEEGKQRASLFAVALGAVTALAIWRFSEPHGGALSTVALPIDFALLGLIWWCAHKLVWDCTLIDDQQDASGEGLLATMGWEGAAASAEGDAGASSAAQPGAANGRPGSGRNDGTAEHRTANIERPTSSRKPHAPGKWVIYFSLAALPIFGIGQLFIPSSDLERRQYVLRLMVQYVAAGLGLLLATSFLGLRRYLRQRHVQMPTKMAGGWVGAGAALIVAVLLFCLVLPRPDAELAISSISGNVGSDFQTSRHAVGSDGPLRKEGDRSRASQEGNPQSSGGNQKNGQSGGGGNDKNGNEQGGGDNQGKSGGGDPSKSQDNASNSNQNNGDTRQADDNGQQGDSKGSEGQNGGESKQQPSDENSQDNENGDENRSSEQGGSQQSGGQNSAEDQGGANSGDARGRQADSRSSESSSSRPSSWSAGKWFGNTVRWLFYLALLVLGVFLAWRYRREIAAAWRQLIADLKKLWAGLFGGKRAEKPFDSATATTESTAQPSRPFAEYANPFLTGAANRQPPAEIVSYSFRALEAWARERGAERQPEHTPREFAQHVARTADHLADDAERLAALYSQVAYAPGAIDSGQIETLRPLWHGMETDRRSPAPRA